MRGDSAGHPSGERPFPGGCWEDVKVPSRIIASRVWIALGKIRSLLQVEKMACIQSQKSAFQYLHVAPVQRRIASIDSHFTSPPLCGFCVMSLGIPSGSQPAHHVTCQSFSAGTTSVMKNHAQVGPTSRTIGINESTICLRGWRSWRNLRWHHSTKMADHEVLLLALVEAGFLGKNQLPSQAPQRISVLSIAHLNPSESERMLCPVRQLKLYLQDS